MYKAIANLMTWYDEHKIDVNDITGLLITLVLGNFIKIYREPDNPNKWRFTRFISELLISSLIATTFFIANDLWLHLPYLFTLILCVWFGSLSSKIYDEMDNFLSWAFDTVKAYINKKFLTSLLVIFSAGILLTGCKSSQPVAFSQNETLKKEASSKIINKETIRNQTLIDSLKILIGQVKTAKPECDSIAQEQIQHLLSRINTRKTSGDNSFGAYYDKLKNELVIHANIAATQNEKITALESKLISETQKSKETKPVKYIPKQVKIFAFFGFLAIFYLLYKILKPIILWVGKRQLPLPW